MLIRLTFSISDRNTQGKRIRGGVGSLAGVGLSEIKGFKTPTSTGSPSFSRAKSPLEEIVFNA
ncbi:MAG: hypothetical protein RMY36_009305 [Nostoc sp. SerVER01]|nr:hypothetical protein [Nostoc sp. SerVER01]